MEMRAKRDEYIAKLTELERKQIELNKFEISCMVREKTAKASAASLSDWVITIFKFRLAVS